MAALGQVSLRAQTNYEKGDRAPDADYLALLAGAGVDVGFLVTGTPSGNLAPAGDADWVGKVRLASETDRATIARVIAAILNDTAGSTNPADNLPPEIALIEMFDTILSTIDLTQPREEIAKLLAQSLAPGLRGVEGPLEIEEHDGAHDDNHGELPLTRRA
jgi:hypothetical protein